MQTYFAVTCSIFIIFLAIVPSLVISFSQSQEPLVPLQVSLIDGTWIHLENERAFMKIIVKNPSNKFILGKLEGSVTSVPPTQTYSTIMSEFRILPHDEATINVT